MGRRRRWRSSFRRGDRGGWGVRFGKGRHPAGLNFSDCLTYAVAHLTGQPLFCVGTDFPHTDLEIVGA